MKHVIFLWCAIVLLSCEQEKEKSSVSPENWADRSVDLTAEDSLYHAKTYLPVYSEIYSFSENQTNVLTVTVSLRNTNTKAPVFIKKASYYNAQGSLVRTYFEKPIYLKPLETVEIIIDETDTEGGVAGNFLFEWATNGKQVNDPFFEAVMISTRGQQGLSFTTHGIKLNN